MSSSVVSTRNMKSSVLQSASVGYTGTWVWEWYENPDRACAGDDRYTDFTLLSRARTSGPMRDRGKTRKQQIDSMCDACLCCPVYFECLQDLLQHPLYTHWGVRAGIKGRSS